MPFTRSTLANQGSFTMVGLPSRGCQDRGTFSSDWCDTKTVITAPSVAFCILSSLLSFIFLRNAELLFSWFSYTGFLFFNDNLPEPVPSATFFCVLHAKRNHSLILSTFILFYILNLC